MHSRLAKKTTDNLPKLWMKLYVWGIHYFNAMHTTYTCQISLMGAKTNPFIICYKHFYLALLFLFVIFSGVLLFGLFFFLCGVSKQSTIEIWFSGVVGRERSWPLPKVSEIRSSSLKSSSFGVFCLMNPSVFKLFSIIIWKKSFVNLSQMNLVSVFIKRSYLTSHNCF